MGCSPTNAGSMRQSGQSHIKGFLAQAAIVCGFVLLLWPTSAHAEIGRCVENSVSDLAEQGVASFLTMTPATPETPLSLQADADLGADGQAAPAETPCGDNPDADPSSNFCFEDAGGQISTLPRLLAQWRAQQTANTVIDSMLAAMEQQADDADAKPATPLTAESIDVEPEPADDQSCHTSPDECRSLPPAPPTLVVDASAPAARQLVYASPILPRLTPDNPRAWAQLRIGPLNGHQDPPEQPPRA